MNIFQDNTKSIPYGKSDSQIVRTPMDQIDIAGRKSNIPASGKSTDMSVSHIPSRG